MQEDSGSGTASGGVVGGPAGGDAVEDTPAASPPSPESPPLPPSPQSPESPESPTPPESPTNGTSSSDGGSTPAASPPSPESPTNGATDGAEGPTPSPPASFYKEGDTIKCPNAAVGDEGEVDGVTYTKRDRGGLAGLVKENNNNPKLSTSCTSSVTDMSNMWVLTSPAVRLPAPTRSRSRSLRASLARSPGSRAPLPSTSPSIAGTRAR